MSKILVAYYSKTGNTKRAAEDIARALGADLEQIKDKRNRKGFFAWFASGRDGMRKNKTEIETSEKNPSNYDMIIAGSPVWGWNITPAVRTYLDDNRGSIKEYAFFVTSGNTSSEKIVLYVREIMDRDPFVHIGLNAAELKDKNIYEKKIKEFAEAFKRYQFSQDQRLGKLYS